MSYISVATDIAKGGNFLSWSIRYLNGQNEYYYDAYDKVIALSPNPLTQTNSHNHLENHPVSLEHLHRSIDKVCTRKDLNLLYTHIIRDDEHLLDTEQTRLLYETVQQTAQSVCLLDNPPENILYDCSTNTRTTMTVVVNGNEERIRTPEQWKEWFIDQYFLKDKQSWSKKSLNNIWDEREFLSLNIRPFQKQTVKDLTNLQADFVFTTTELWTGFDNIVHTLLDCLQLGFDQKRYSSWLPIYKQWQEIHKQKLLFCRCFDEIVYNILHNKNMDLESLDLDIMQEAAIQHYMIFFEGLNFKTWQLEKFQNTTQLHSLLEPNIHEITTYNFA